MTPSEEIDAQYRGFLQTPGLGALAKMPGIHLWSADSVEQHHGLAPPPDWFGPESNILGKRMERMFYWQLKQSERFEVLMNSLQIQSQQVTIGELDFVLKDNTLNQLIHLEFAYKLYLYHPESTLPGELWVGPNRRDTLHRKLKKLREQQFAMLNHPSSRKLFAEHGWDKEKISQWLYLKTQLYIPVNYSDQLPPGINPLAVAGFWIRQDKLTGFKDHSFFLPKKINWSMLPHKKAEWVSYNLAQEEIKDILAKKQSPMCWTKSPQGKLERMFVVWW